MARSIKQCTIDNQRKHGAIVLGLGCCDWKPDRACDSHKVDSYLDLMEVRALPFSSVVGHHVPSWIIECRGDLPPVVVRY